MSVHVAIDESSPESNAVGDDDLIASCKDLRREGNRRDSARRLLVAVDDTLGNLVGMELDGVDLRGANLAGCTIARTSLRGANLDGADLRRARIEHADLGGASLRGARLDGSRWTFVAAPRSCWTGARANQAKLEHVDLEAAELFGTSLRGARIGSCSLEGTRIDASDLSASQLVHSRCEAASFHGAMLDGAITVGSTFARADLTNARCYASCREIVLELLLRAVPIGDSDVAKLIAAVAARRDWCHNTWRAILADHPRARDFALATFAEHPTSGVLDALAA